MDSNFSLADIRAATEGNDGGGVFGGGGGGGMWIFALLILLLIGSGGGGGLFGGANGRAATSADVQRATDFAALERQNNETVSAVRQAAYDVTGSVKDGQYNILGELRDLQTATASGFSDVQRCCCETMRAIDGVNYNGAINTASINATTTAQTQKILDALAQNKIETLQGRVNELQLQIAMCGVPRISPYGFGLVPDFARNPCCNGCNGGN